MCLPQLGHGMLCSSMNVCHLLLRPCIDRTLPAQCPFPAQKSSISLSARKRSWHSLQSISGSEKPPRCPEATQVCGFIRIAQSTPTLYGFSCDELLPPCSFYIVFQLNAEVSVIPCICQTSVNLRARIYKSSALLPVQRFCPLSFPYCSSSGFSFIASENENAFCVSLDYSSISKIM